MPMSAKSRITLYIGTAPRYILTNTSDRSIPNIRKKYIIVTLALRCHWTWPHLLFNFWHGPVQHNLWLDMQQDPFQNIGHLDHLVLKFFPAMFGWFGLYVYVYVYVHSCRSFPFFYSNSAYKRKRKFVSQLIEFVFVEILVLASESRLLLRGNEKWNTKETDSRLWYYDKSCIQ